MTLKYRPEIDGIRAIAVLAVVLFHLSIAGFNGGFIGVDMFFVISGYLITTILLREVEGGTISLSLFYERRARRILPLMIAIIVFCLLVTWPLYIQSVFAAFGTSVAGAASFVSNLVFMRRKGYFIPSVHEDPLLHLWSLSVEEQFYIFLPVCLLLLHKYCRRSFAYWLFGLAAISFALNLLICGLSPKVAFYISPTRAWEFFAGGLLSLPLVRTTSIAKFLAWLGVIAISVSVLFFDDSIAYPGVYALLPVTGTAMIIYGISDDLSLVKSILSWKPLVFIGRISYSVYMWHWPLLVFANMLVVHTMSAVQNVLFLLFLIIISTLSYYFIEQPFRNKQLLRKSASFALTCLVSLLVVGGTGVFIKKGNGLPGRFMENKLVADAEKDPFLPLIVDDNTRQYYPIGDTDTTASFVLWGDSYARAFSYGIDSLAKRIHTSGYCITSYLTPPLSDVNIKGQNFRITKSTSQAFDFIKNHREIHSIILAGRWSNYYSDKYIELVADKAAKREQAKAKLFEYSLTRTIDILLSMGRIVYLAEPLPELDASINKIIFKKRILGRDINANGVEVAEYAARNDSLHQIFNRLRAEKRIHLVNIISYLPATTRYFVELNGQLLYRDAHHLSIKGSQLVAPAFQEAIR
ncbi:MAG: acyltransferase [Bacteroidetes bacterium]|nr:acyltransferase [Bacteroidota bacterium]